MRWTALALCSALITPATLGQWGVLDTTFNPGGGKSAGFNRDVTVIQQQPDGRLLIGGAFTEVDKTSRSHIARVSASGSLDTSFVPPTIPGDTIQLGVEAMALQPDGRILIGGRFEDFGSHDRDYLARLQPDGSLDATFHPTPDLIVFAIGLQASGHLVVGGGFTSIDGAPRQRVARLNPDGSVDDGFDPGPGPNGAVFAVAPQPDGRVLIGGAFTAISGSPRSRLARLLSDGSLDPTFDPGDGPNDIVYALALQPDGRIIAAGSFTNFAGHQRHYVVRLRPDGTQDTDFQSDIALTFGGVTTLRSAPDGKILIGGDFQTIDGTRRVGIARLHINGRLDTTFGSGTEPAYSSGSSVVKGIALQADGKVMFGGRFDSVNGVKLNYLARLTGDQGGQVEFVNATDQVDESAETIRIPLRRLGSTAGQVSVDVAVTAGTAAPETDFLLPSRTVFFEPGETTQAILVNIPPDAPGEPDEHFVLSLGNPIGGILLGPTGNTTITLRDSAISPTPKFASVERFDADRLRLSLSAVTGSTCILETSPALDSWTAIQTNVALNDTCLFEISGLADSARRFFRARVP